MNCLPTSKHSLAGKMLQTWLHAGLWLFCRRAYMVDCLNLARQCILCARKKKLNPPNSEAAGAGDEQWAGHERFY